MLIKKKPAVITRYPVFPSHTLLISKQKSSMQMIWRQQGSTERRNPIKAGNFSPIAYHWNHTNLPENRYWRNNYFCIVFYCSPEPHCARRNCKKNFRKQVSLYKFQIRPWRINLFQNKKYTRSLLIQHLILTASYFSEKEEKKSILGCLFFGFFQQSPQATSPADTIYFKIPSPCSDICLIR